MTTLLKKLRLENKEFVTSSELKAYCRSLRMHYPTVIRYFHERGYLVRVFRGIFYVRSLEELKLGRNRYTPLELVAKGLDLKKVRHWYFGLHTALKLNNMTHEHFTVEDVVNDTVFRANPIRIAGYSFKFSKFSPSLLEFGVREGERGVRYSDPEKTLLDFMYLWRYNGVPGDKIVGDIKAWAHNTSHETLRRYASKYPKTVAEIVEHVIG